MLAASNDLYFHDTSSQPTRYPYTAYPASTSSPSAEGQFKQQRQNFPWDVQLNNLPNATEQYQQHPQFMQSTNPQIRLQQLPNSSFSHSSQTPSLQATDFNGQSRQSWSNMERGNSGGKYGGASTMPRTLMRSSNFPQQQTQQTSQHQRGPSNSSNESRMSGSYTQQPMHTATSGYPTPSYDALSFGMNSLSHQDQAGMALQSYPKVEDVPPLSPANRAVHRSSRQSQSSDFQAPLTPRTHVTDDLDHSLEGSTIGENHDDVLLWMNEYLSLGGLPDFKSNSKMGSELDALNQMYASNFNQHQTPVRMQQVSQRNGLLSPTQALDGYIKAARSSHDQQHSSRSPVGFQSPYQQQIDSASASTPKTISPKDTLLEINEQDDEANLMPLFPTESSQSSQKESDPFAPLPGLRRDSSAFSASNNTFPMFSSGTVLNQYPFVSRRQDSLSGLSDFKTPTMLRMETSSSDYQSDVSKPTSTRADGGTYTCTYHGCTMRFESPQQLQKHKREGHRQAHAAPSGDLTPGGSMKDSQAGPHKCSRINPSTGKPCNTMFSRPYDLTRHEDTIHNAKKQKVRCELCTEEKTFSRNDALTRHMRVVHPDVNWPGKTRRKNAVN
jgi:hypothetical protein